MELDNSYENENDLSQLKMISESANEILNDFENHEKNTNKDLYNIEENKYIENMRNLEQISLSKEKSIREKRSILTIKKNVESIFNEISKDLSYLHKKRKKFIKKQNTKN